MSQAWMKIGELNDLRRRVSLAGFPEPVQYALFSRSGFDPNLTQVARAEGVLLFGVNDLFKKPARPRRPRSAGS